MKQLIHVIQKFLPGPHTSAQGQQVIKSLGPVCTSNTRGEVLLENIVEPIARVHFRKLFVFPTGLIAFIVDTTHTRDFPLNMGSMVSVRFNRGSETFVFRAKVAVCFQKVLYTFLPDSIETWERRDDPHVAKGITSSLTLNFRDSGWEKQGQLLESSKVINLSAGGLGFEVSYADFSFMPFIGDEIQAVTLEDTKRQQSFKCDLVVRNVRVSIKHFDEGQAAMSAINRSLYIGCSFKDSKDKAARFIESLSA